MSCAERGSCGAPYGRGILQVGRTTVVALAGQKSNGEPVHEELLVERDGDAYGLVATPALVIGVAADDLIQIDQGGTVTVLSRGGNVAVQLFGEHEWGDELAIELAPYGARIDARAPQLTVLTVPVRVGFATVESALAEWSGRHPAAEWYYGNVYAADGLTPLNWW